MSYFNFLSPQDVPLGPDSGPSLPQQQVPQNDPKGKVKKAHADIQNAYGEAMKVLRESPFVPPEHDPEGQAMNPTTDFNDLQKVMELVEQRGVMDPLKQTNKVEVNPIRIADDLRTIAARKSVPPEYAKKLFSAADKLTRAYQAQGELEELRKPGQPLAITKPEIAGRQAWLGSEIQKREEALKTAGMLRTPQLQEEMKKLREEEGRVAGAAQNPEFGPPDPPDFDSTIKAAGMNRGTFLERAALAIQKMGAIQNDKLHPGSFPIALRSVLSAMGQAGDAVVKGFVDAAKPKPGDMTQKSPDQLAGKKPLHQSTGAEEDPYAQRIEDRQDEVMRAVRELKNLKTFDSTWKVVLFAVFSMVLGPGPAAVMFTNKAKRGELQFELEALQKDLDRLIRVGDQKRRYQEAARHHAVMEKQGQARIDQDKYMDDEYLKLRRETPRGKDPVADQLLGAYRMWKDEVDEAGDVLNEQFDYTEREIREARAKKAKALPALEAVRGQILKYRQQKLAELQKPQSVAGGQ